MQKPKLLYYLHTYFIDSALEWLTDLRSEYEIHLVVELSPDSLKSTVIDIEQKMINNDFGDLMDILDTSTKSLVTPYFNGLKSIKYIFYPTTQILSLSNLKMAFKVLYYVKKEKIRTIHFDTISGRFMPVLPFLYNIKCIATIHDPIPHTGEDSFKKSIIRKIYSNIINKYLFYSRYSYRQFVINNRQSYSNIFTAQLKPYSYISKLNTSFKKDKKYILYFGRISYYKGIDILLDSFQSILSHYPKLNLIIAGNGDIKIIPAVEMHTDNIKILNKYVSIQELADLIKNALFVVCPYREATQSGVLMTAFALNKPVLATNVGAFPEYIIDNVNGMLVDPTVNGIEKGILRMLKNNYYKDLEIKMNSFAPKRIINNANIYSELYTN